MSNRHRSRNELRTRTDETIVHFHKAQYWRKRMLSAVSEGDRRIFRDSARMCLAWAADRRERQCLATRRRSLALQHESAMGYAACYGSGRRVRNGYIND